MWEWSPLNASPTDPINHCKTVPGKSLYLHIYETEWQEMRIHLEQDFDQNSVSTVTAFLVSVDLLQCFPPFIFKLFPECGLSAPPNPLTWTNWSFWCYRGAAGNTAWLFRRNINGSYKTVSLHAAFQLHDGHGLTHPAGTSSWMGPFPIGDFIVSTNQTCIIIVCSLTTEEGD